MAAHLYSEHLVNIRSLTIQAILSSFVNEDTRIWLSGDGGDFSLSHESVTTTIKLPVAVPDHARGNLVLPARPSKDLSFRLRIDETANLAGRALGGTTRAVEGHQGTGEKRQVGETTTIVPWTSRTLSNQIALHCNKCNGTIMHPGTIQQWKDLPSESWAEMMEFWHCHKPAEPADGTHQTAKKGYAAGSTLTIASTIGLINATSFILATDDCTNVQVGTHPFKLTGHNKEPKLPGCKAATMETRDNVDPTTSERCGTGFALAQAVGKPRGSAPPILMSRRQSL